jgi:hypothetical protein
LEGLDNPKLAGKGASTCPAKIEELETGDR